MGCGCLWLHIRNSRMEYPSSRLGLTTGLSHQPDGALGLAHHLGHFFSTPSIILRILISGNL